MVKQLFNSFVQIELLLRALRHHFEGKYHIYKEQGNSYREKVFLSWKKKTFKELALGFFLNIFPYFADFE